MGSTVKNDAPPIPGETRASEEGCPATGSAESVSSGATQTQTTQKGVVPVTLLTGFCGKEILIALQKLMQGKSSQFGCVISSDYKWTAAKFLPEDFEKDVQWSEMVSVWDWATQSPNGVLHCIEKLVKSAKSRQLTYDRIFLLAGPRAEPGVIVRDMVDVSLRFHPRFVNNQYINLLEKEVFLDQAVAVVDALEWETGLKSLCKLADMFDQGNKSNGKCEAQAQLLLEHVEFADVVLLVQANKLSKSNLDSVKESIQALNHKATILNLEDAEAAAVLEAPRHMCNFRDPVQGVLDRAFEFAKSSPPPEPKEDPDPGSLSHYHYLRHRPFHNGRLREHILRRWVPFMDKSKWPKKEATAGGIEPPTHFPVVVFPEPNAAQGLTIALMRSKGLIWLADLWEQSVVWDQSRAHFHVCFERERATPWYGALLEEFWPRDPLQQDRMLMDFGPVKSYADRRNEIVFIGKGLDFKELVKDLDACLLTDKEMQRPGNTHWAGSSAMDPPNRIVTTWHAREAERRAVLDREARELRIKNRTLAQQQAREAEERDAEAKLAAQELARKDEEAKQAEALLERIEKEQEWREQQKKKAEEQAQKNKLKQDRKKREKMEKEAQEAKEREEAEQFKNLVEWQGVNKLQNSKAELLKAIATRIDKLLGDKCTATTWDCVNEQGNASNNACPACLVDFTPSLQVRTMKCNHVGCRSCMDMWFDHVAAEGQPLSCPLCRTLIGVDTPKDWLQSKPRQPPSKPSAPPAPAPSSSSTAKPKSPEKMKSHMASSSTSSIASAGSRQPGPDIEKAGVDNSSRQTSSKLEDSKDAIATALLIESLAKHSTKSCAVVTFKNVKASNALLLNPPRQFVNGVQLTMSPHQAVNESAPNPLAIYIYWKGPNSSVSDSEIMKTVQGALLAALPLANSSKAPHGDSASGASLAATTTFPTVSRVGTGEFQKAPPDSCIEKLKMTWWNRPVCILVFKQASAYQVALAQHPHLSGTISGVYVRVQEYVDKVSGKQEPKTLFLSWEEKCDVKSADIVKYFDSKVFPSESPGSGAMYPAQAPQSQFITPTTGPSVMDSSPMKSQQERVSLYSAAGGLQTSGPALDSEAEQGKTCELQNLDHHDWDAINSAAARGVNANEGPYGPMLLHVSVQRNKSNTIVIFKEGQEAMREVLLSLEPRTIHESFLAMYPHKDNSGRKDPRGVFITLEQAYQMSEDEVSSAISEALMEDRIAATESDLRRDNALNLSHWIQASSEKSAKRKSSRKKEAPKAASRSSLDAEDARPVPAAAAAATADARAPPGFEANPWLRTEVRCTNKPDMQSPPMERVHSMSDSTSETPAAQYATGVFASEVPLEPHDDVASAMARVSLDPSFSHGNVMGAHWDDTEPSRELPNGVEPYAPDEHMGHQPSSLFSGGDIPQTHSLGGENFAFGAFSNPAEYLPGLGMTEIALPPEGESYNYDGEYSDEANPHPRVGYLQSRTPPSTPHANEHVFPTNVASDSDYGYVFGQTDGALTYESGTGVEANGSDASAWPSQEPTHTAGMDFVQLAMLAGAQETPPPYLHYRHSDVPAPVFPFQSASDAFPSASVSTPSASNSEADMPFWLQQMMTISGSQSDLMQEQHVSTIPTYCPPGTNPFPAPYRPPSGPVFPPAAPVFGVDDSHIPQQFDTMYSAASSSDHVNIGEVGRSWGLESLPYSNFVDSMPYSNFVESNSHEPCLEDDDMADFFPCLS